MREILRHFCGQRSEIRRYRLMRRYFLPVSRRPVGDFPPDSRDCPRRAGWARTYATAAFRSDMRFGNLSFLFSFARLPPLTSSVPGEGTPMSRNALLARCSATSLPASDQIRQRVGIARDRRALPRPAAPLSAHATNDDSRDGRDGPRLPEPGPLRRRGRGNTVPEPRHTPRVKRQNQEQSALSQRSSLPDPPLSVCSIERAR